MMNLGMGITLKMTNFRTVGVPEKIHYHVNRDRPIGGNFSCGCWQCCKIDSSNNLTEYATAYRVYSKSDIWLDHHYD